MSDNTLDYVVHSGFVYEADEWYNSYDGQRYDDVLKVTVNLNHPDYPEDDEKLYDD